jgi:TonB family protein
MARRSFANPNSVANGSSTLPATTLLITLLLVLLVAPVLALENKPIAILVPSLEYPVIALRAGVSGSVVVECSLNADGQVESVQLVSGPPELFKAVLDNAKQWRFSVERLQTSGERRVRLTYEFKIKGVASGGKIATQFFFLHPYKALISAPRPYAAIY